jgi:hypothetical protein
MENYKINIDKPSPKKEDTNKFKNFNNVVSDYKKMHSPWSLLKGLYRDKQLIRIFIIIMAVLIAIFFGTKQVNNDGTSKEIEDIKKEIIKKEK